MTVSQELGNHEALAFALRPHFHATAPEGTHLEPAGEELLKIVQSYASHAPVDPNKLKLQRYQRVRALLISLGLEQIPAGEGAWGRAGSALLRSLRGRLAACSATNAAARPPGRSRLRKESGLAN